MSTTESILYAVIKTAGLIVKTKQFVSTDLYK